MTTKSKLILLTAIAAVTLASPAFAQSSPELDTGSAWNQSERSLGYYAPSQAPQNEHIAGQQNGLNGFAMVRQQNGRNGFATAPRVTRQQNGLNGFAMVPGGQTDYSLNPAATGGGSIGYNENLRQDQW
jgi:hypothetical protein